MDPFSWCYECWGVVHTSSYCACLHYACWYIDVYQYLSDGWGNAPNNRTSLKYYIFLMSPVESMGQRTSVYAYATECDRPSALFLLSDMDFVMWGFTAFLLWTVSEPQRSPMGPCRGSLTVSHACSISKTPQMSQHITLPAYKLQILHMHTVTVTFPTWWLKLKFWQVHSPLQVLCILSLSVLILAS